MNICQLCGRPIHYGMGHHCHKTSTNSTFQADPVQAGAPPPEQASSREVASLSPLPPAPPAVQLTFDLHPLVTPDYAPKASIQDRWEAWKVANPWVLPTLEHLVAAWLTAGHRRASIKQVWEVLRYQYGQTTGDRFRANNDFTSRAVRDLIAMHPEWVDAFETRELRAA